MSTTFRPYQPNQLFLLPPSPKDWLREDHLAYFISETVDRLDVSVFYRCYEGDGRRNCPFDPRMMVKVLLYGYATGVRSSRKIAKKLHEDVAFRVLAAGNFPAHRTIAEFRQRHLKEFEELFVQVVQLAQEIGLLKLGTLALDGSKVKANASKRKAMSYGRMKKEREASAGGDWQAIWSRPRRWMPRKIGCTERKPEATNFPKNCDGGKTVWPRSRRPSDD